MAQDPVIALTFTGMDGIEHRQLDSIYVENVSRGEDTALFWPDTILTLDYVLGSDGKAVNEHSSGLFVYPNPFRNRCHIVVEIPSRGKTDILISDILGRQSILFSGYLQRGTYNFDFSPGDELIYFFTIIRGETIMVQKLIHTGSDGGKPRLTGTGMDPALKVHPKLKKTRGFSFEWGDRLLYAGYSNGNESGISDVPTDNRFYTFQTRWSSMMVKPTRPFRSKVNAGLRKTLT